MKLNLAPIISSSEVLPDIHLVRVEDPEIAKAAKPGQFVMVRCGDDNLLRRPLSIHQVDGDKLALLFNVVGRGTSWLSQRVKGESLDLFGPLGNGFVINPAAKNLLLVAGGIGIAPLCFLAQEAANRGQSVRFLIGAATASQLCPEDLLPKACEHVCTTEDGSSGKAGMITDIVPEHIGWAEQVLACGPAAMYRTMAQMPELENKPVQVSLEVRMGCGAGVCYGCTVKTTGGLKQVCRDGPIFNLNEILREELV